MRARYSDTNGYTERDGVKIYYEVYGDWSPTILLMPTWSLFHSRHWKMQIPYLARHFRVVTFDGRGNGKSDRPLNREDHSYDQYLDDALEVMDATGTDEAVVAGLSFGGYLTGLFAGLYPDRTLGAVCITPSTGLGPALPERVEYSYTDELDATEGWAKQNVHFIRAHHREYVEWFVSNIFTEPHSTKGFDDGVGWAMETDAETLIVTDLAEMVTGEDLEAIYRSISCPMLIITGSDDHIIAPASGARLAKLTGAHQVILDGSGHAPQTRDPVKVNLLMKQFIERIKAAMPPSAVWARGLQRRKRALYLSSPIGLGHARRDVAVTQALREIVPDLEVEWLAQDPVTRVLAEEGETLHPASEFLANESAHITSESGEHDLHCFEALRRMDEILLANFMVFQEVMEEGNYDLVIADESWDIDHHWHENPELKRGQLVWMTDFVGYLPVESGGDREAYIAADYNAEMINHIARYPGIRDRAIFVGNPDDIVPDPFGPDLPLIRDWTGEHFTFSGYITGFDPRSLDRDALRAEFGYGTDEKVCVVTVGGSGVGGDLIRRVISGYPEAADKIPGLRMIVVAGPRIDPATLSQPEGVEIYPFINRLYRNLTACDVAVVQGGLTTTMELTASRRPFLYFPLRNHFEQNFHVRHRLDGYRAGRYMEFATAGPDEIAEALAAELSRPTDYREVETDGAATAAARIAELL